MSAQEGHLWTPEALSSGLRGPPLILEDVRSAYLVGQAKIGRRRNNTSELGSIITSCKVCDKVT